MRVVKRRPKPKPVQRTTPVASEPTVAQKPAPVRVQIGTPTAAVTTAGDDVRRALIITGLGISILLFLVAGAVPATAVRFTLPGRVLTEHQTDLVLSGIATLLLTLMLFLVTGR